VNGRSEAVLSVATMNAGGLSPGQSHAMAGHRSDHGGSMREYYDKMANDRAHALAEASLLKA